MEKVPSCFCLVVKFYTLIRIFNIQGNKTRPLNSIHGIILPLYIVLDEVYASKTNSGITSMALK